MKRYIIAIILPVTLFLFNSCISLHQSNKHPFYKGSIEDSALQREEAKQLADHLRQFNGGISTFKGLGQIQIRNKKESYSSRLAWIGDTSGKIRFEFFGLYGQPTTSLSTDGTNLYFYSHAEDRYYKRHAANLTLEPYLEIPLTLNDAVHLLAGRIPIKRESLVRLIENTSGDGFVLLVLEKKSGNMLKIHFNKSKNHVVMMENYLSNGSLSYRAVFGNRRTVKPYLIPFAISIYDEKGNVILIEYDRYWVNMNVNPSIFVLEQPK